MVFNMSKHFGFTLSPGLIGGQTLESPASSPPRWNTTVVSHITLPHYHFCPFGPSQAGLVGILGFVRGPKCECCVCACVLVPVVLVPFGMRGWSDWWVSPAAAVADVSSTPFRVKTRSMLTPRRSLFLSSSFSLRG